MCVCGFSGELPFQVKPFFVGTVIISSFTSQHEIDLCIIHISCVSGLSNVFVFMLCCSKNKSNCEQFSVPHELLMLQLH